MTRLRTPEDCPEHIHGTPSGYSYYGCRCDVCRRGNRERHRRMREDRQQRLHEAPHGTPGGYVNWGCRCGDCTAAYSQYQRAKVNGLVVKKSSRSRRRVPTTRA